MSKNGYDSIIGGLEKLLEAVRSHEGDLLGAEPLRAALESHLEEIKEAQSRRELHSAGRLRATRDREQSLAAGRETAIHIRSLVKSAFGPRDGRLAQFGVAPLKSGVRKPRKKQPSTGSSSPEPAK